MRMILAGLALALSLPHSATADSGTITIASRHSVAETMDRFEAAVKSTPEPTQVFARIDLQRVAGTQAGKVRPTQLIIFGRGGVLREVLPQTPQAGIDLPPKAVVWEDESGKVWITVNSGEYVEQRHGVKGKADLMKRLTQFAESYARKAAE